MKRIIVFIALIVCLVFTTHASRRRLLSVSASANPGTLSFSTNTFSATSMSIDYPSGVAAGGVVCVTVITDTVSDIATASFPSGWLLVRSNVFGSGGFNAAVRATDGTESGSVTFSFNGATESGTAIMTFFPSCTTNLADGSSVQQDTPGAGVAMTTATLTPSVDNCYLYSCFYIDPVGSPSFTNVPPYTFLGSAVRSGNGAQGVTYVQQGTAGAQTQQLISSEGGTWGTFQISFKP